MSETNNPARRSGLNSSSAIFGTTTKPYLGNPEIVGGVWGALIGGIINRSVQSAAGEIDRAAEEKADEDAYALAEAIISGQDPGYEPIKGWNTEAGLGGLGAFIQQRLEPHVHPDYWKPPFNPVKALVYITVGQTHNLIAGLGSMSEEDAQAEVSRLINEATNLCLGTAALQDVLPD